MKRLENARIIYCGIAGIFGSNILSIDFDDKIEKMLNSQASGP